MGYETILQISDIHIRAGDSHQSRYDEYVTQIDRLLQAIETYDADSTLVVLLGDIFHDKSKIGPSAQMLAQRLFNGLSRLQTVVIRGNHDYNQAQPDEPDLIKPFFESQPENLEYKDETGLYQIGDVEIGIVAVQDTLIRGAAGGITNSLPPFPEPTEDDDTVAYRVALFHGSFGGALLQSGIDVDKRNNYPIEWIPKGYDLSLFGDIHVQQIHRAKAEPGNDFTSRETKTVYVSGRYGYNGQKPWGYAGSLIQQNFGEALWGHGFVEWNLKQKVATAYHVRNDVGLVVVSLNSSDEPCVKFRVARRWQLLPVKTIVTYGWFPKKISLRFDENATKMVQPIQSMFEEAGIVVQDTGFADATNLEDASTANVTPEQKTELVNDLTTLNSPQEWINFFAKDLQPGDWSQWVLHPNLLLCPIDIFDGATLAKVQERNNKFKKTVENYTAARDTKAPTRLFRIHYMEFANLLCFGQQNWIDFDTFTKTICLVNGNNGSGKSSLLEIICIAIYGEPFPSRYNKSNSAAIISQNLKAHDSAKTRILVSVNGKKYWIHRTFEREDKAPKRVKQRYVTLTEVETNEVLCKNPNVVDPWIDENIGKFSNFLLTTIMSQSNDSDFFAAGSKEQKLIVDSLLNLNVCEDFKTILKEAKLNHEYAMTSLDSYESGVKSQSSLVSTLQEQDIGSLEERRVVTAAQLATVTSDAAAAKANFSGFAERVFQTPSEDYERELREIKLVKPEEDYDSLKTRRAQLRDRLAVLKSKRYPASLPSAAIPFDEAEKALSALKARRAYTSAPVYDAAAHKAWLKTPKPPVVPSEVPLVELQRLTDAAKAELDTYEIDEDLKPVSAKVLAGLKKQHDDLTAQLEELEREQILGEKELKAITLSPAAMAKLQQYTAAVEKLNCDPVVAAAHVAKAAELTLTQQHVLAELSSIAATLKEVGEVKYNPKCSECLTNPFKHKKESLLAQKSQLTQKKASIDAQVAALPQPFDQFAKNYEEWRALHNNVILTYMNNAARCSELKISLQKTKAAYVKKEEEREDLEYETMAMTNEYYEIKAQTELLSNQLAHANYEKEKADWTASAAVAELDEQIASAATAAAAAHAAETATTSVALQDADAKLASHEVYNTNSRRKAELANILAAIPFHAKHATASNKVSLLSQELSSIDAQIQQSKLLHSKLEHARTHAQRIVQFRDILQTRSKTIKTMSDAFDTYTDWLYPSKVGPAIETAVNAVLNSISLPRPIKLIAEWSDSGNFNWLVQDGTNKPPIEKCSGAQRFFVSLALRFAFSRMGASNMINAQIFLDEGFTACDAETMERVPTLLSNLLKELDYLQTIYLVSHMEALKSIATRSILIQRGAHASQLQIGDRQAIHRAAVTKTTVGATKPLERAHDAEEGEVQEAIPVPRRRGKAAQIKVV
jgi:DNA repair exonuclease SbcCD ATPase subunit